MAKKLSPIEHVQLLGDKTVAARWLPFARRKFRVLDSGKGATFFKVLAVADAVIRMTRTGKVRTILIQGLGGGVSFLCHYKGITDWNHPEYRPFLVTARCRGEEVVWRAKEVNPGRYLENYGNQGWSDGKKSVSWWSSESFYGRVFFEGEKVFELSAATISQLAGEYPAGRDLDIVAAVPVGGKIAVVLVQRIIKPYFTSPAPPSWPKIEVVEVTPRISWVTSRYLENADVVNGDNSVIHRSRPDRVLSVSISPDGESVALFMDTHVKMLKFSISDADVVVEALRIDHPDPNVSEGFPGGDGSSEPIPREHQSEFYTGIVWGQSGPEFISLRSSIGQFQLSEYDLDPISGTHPTGGSYTTTLRRWTTQVNALIELHYPDGRNLTLLDYQVQSLITYRTWAAYSGYNPETNEWEGGVVGGDYTQDSTGSFLFGCLLGEAAAPEVAIYGKSEAESWEIVDSGVDTGGPPFPQYPYFEGDLPFAERSIQAFDMLIPNNSPASFPPGVRPVASISFLSRPYSYFIYIAWPPTFLSENGFGFEKEVTLGLVGKRAHANQAHFASIQLYGDSSDVFNYLTDNPTLEGVFPEDVDVTQRFDPIIPFTR